MTALDLGGIAGPVLVVAPHPDDESIGCGGLIATLRHRGIAVAIVIMTDGTGSQLNSPRYPAPRLAALRETEAREALSILNVDRRDVSFWRLGDRYVPTRGDDLDRAVARARTELQGYASALLVVPGRTDAHGDHRATWAIWTRAAASLSKPPRVLEYVVWPGPERPQGVVVTLDIAGRAAAEAPRRRHPSLPTRAGGRR